MHFLNKCDYEELNVLNRKVEHTVRGLILLFFISFYVITVFLNSPTIYRKLMGKIRKKIAAKVCGYSAKK